MIDDELARLMCKGIATPLTFVVAQLNDMNLSYGNTEAENMEDNNPTDLMDFSEALIYLREGRKLFRQGWNGENIYIILMPGYPEGISANAATEKMIQIPHLSTVKVRPYFVLVDVSELDGPPVISSWVPSSGDLLGSDWLLFGVAG